MERARVLIIEENRRIVGELHDRLVREGYETEVALNGEMGMAIIRDRDMDVAVVDHHACGCEEWDLLRKLHRRVPGLPIVLINGPRRRGISRMARQAGATRFLRAPVNLSRVVDIIGTVLDRNALILK